jgi:hypothetical protein
MRKIYSFLPTNLFYSHILQYAESLYRTKIKNRDNSYSVLMGEINGGKTFGRPEVR